MEYGTGAIFGCPSGDQRDFEFARQYGIEFVPVILPPGADPATFQLTDEAYEGPGTMINSDFLDGLDTQAAFDEVARRLEKATLAGKPVAQRTVNYRLRDWGISRQRYWGCPIPVIHCAGCGVVPVPDEDLPVELPKDATFDKPGNPLDRHPTWKHVECPKCGKDALRETDTMDTFVDSSWYFVRFTAPMPSPSAPEGRRLLKTCRSVYRGSARSCTCSTPALLHARDVRPGHPAQARAGLRRASPDGDARDLQGEAAAGSASRCLEEGARGAVEITTGEPVTIGRWKSRVAQEHRRPDAFVNEYGADVARWFVPDTRPSATTTRMWRRRRADAQHLAARRSGAALRRLRGPWPDRSGRRRGLGAAQTTGYSAIEACASTWRSPTSASSQCSGSAVEIERLPRALREPRSSVR
jgi:leucyl-tRNA synthetase